MERAPRHKRIPDFGRMAITPRDKAIILSVYENRFLKRDQIERLFFTTTSACNQRLQKLYQHRFLDRVFEPVEFGLSQAVYALDKNGAEVVAAAHKVGRNQINWTRRQNTAQYLFLAHTLGVAEINVSLQLALSQRQHTELLFWKREAFLPKEKVRDPENPLPLIPDAFFGLRTNNGELFFFVEADMATQSLERFKNKITAYREYWRSGQFKDRYNYGNFRVLTVTTGPDRLNNLIKVAESAGAKNMFLFTVYGLLSDILGPVWYRPVSLDPTSVLD